MEVVKNSLTRLAKVACVALAFVGTAAVGGSAQGPAPGFNLPVKGGGMMDLADLKGDVVMINFWATWCGPCRTEMPLLDALHKRYSKLGFTLVGVNVEEDPSGADKFLAETPVTFPILFDRKNEVSKLYDVKAMPSTVMVDRKGNIRYIHKGYKDGDENEYQNWIRKLVRER